jgi:hypothetical protein
MLLIVQSNSDGWITFNTVILSWMNSNVQRAMFVSQNTVIALNSSILLRWWCFFQVLPEMCCVLCVSPRTDQFQWNCKQEMFAPNFVYVFVCDKVGPVMILGCITFSITLFVVYHLFSWIREGLLFSSLYWRYKWWICFIFWILFSWHIETTCD